MAMPAELRRREPREEAGVLVVDEDVRARSATGAFDDHDR
jgi:hypothetical protein